MPGRSIRYRDGFQAGEQAAPDNLVDPESRAGLERAFEDDSPGEIVGQIREHQARFAGDIVYDVGEPGGPTERQYGLWDEGLTDGFVEAVEAELTPPEGDQDAEDSE